MAPFTFTDSTAAWPMTGSLRTWVTATNFQTYFERALAPLWTTLRERDRYELARVRRVLVDATPTLCRWALPTVRAYTLRINAAGRPGRRRRHAVKLA